MYKKYNVRTDKTVSTAILIISVAFTVKILPKKNTLALAFNLPELISVIAVPMLRDKIIVRIKSRWWEKYFRKNSIRAPQIAVKMNAPKIGFVFVNKPNVIPASEAWLMVSPIILERRSTIKIPIQGHKREMQMATKKAFCIKS